MWRGKSAASPKAPKRLFAVKLRLLGDVVVRHQGEEEEARAEEEEETQIPVERVMVSLWVTPVLVDVYPYRDPVENNDIFLGTL